jgi:hypothetical protein
VSKTEWIKVIGTKDTYEGLYYIGVHDNKIIILLTTSATGTTDKTRGIIYTLSALDGIIEIERNNFWDWVPISGGKLEDTNLQIINAYTSYQGTFVFVKTLGTLNADKKLSTFTESNNNYYYHAIIYFNLKNEMLAIIFSRSEINLPLISMQPIKVSSDGTANTQFPSINLIGGNDKEVIIYTTTFTNLIEIVNGNTCVAKIANSKLCISCTNCMNQHQCETCTSDSTECIPSFQHGCSNKECSICETDRNPNDSCICEGFEVEGKCQSKCNAGYKALVDNTCVMKCPDNTAMKFNSIYLEDGVATAP